MIRQGSSSIDTKISSMRIGAVCISRNQETWEIKGLPFYNYTKGWKPFQHEQTAERVAYLAERRNTAVAKALDLFPETQHILMIDSYYLPEDLHGCEHNWLCERSGLPVYLSLSRRLSRGPVQYPWLKRIRVSLHLRRLLRGKDW